MTFHHLRNVPLVLQRLAALHKPSATGAMRAYGVFLAVGQKHGG